ncbi:MAG: glycosyltransferase family 4 protein [Anaerolineae bacterium]
MTDRTRVLITITGASVGQPFGGAERFGLELAMQLDQRLCEPTVLALFRIGTVSEEYWTERLTRCGVPWFFATDCAPGEDCQPGEFGPRYLRALRRLPALLAGQRYDVVHSNSHLGSVSMLLLRRRLGNPALLRTAHLPKEWGKNTLFRWLFSDFIYPLTYTATTGVSQEICQRLDGRLGARLRRRHLEYIPNAMDFGRFANVSVDRAALRAELGIPATSPVVGTVGRLTAQKGYDQLLAAAAVLFARLPQARLLVVGDGDLRLALESQAAALGIADRVIFTGARPDVERLLRAMDVFACSSLWEGLPTVMMEAMAAGVPVVATDIPGNRDLIRHGESGWLVPLGEPEAMALQLAGLLQSPQGNEAVAARARDEVERHYSMAAVATRYLDLYQRLAAGRNRAEKAD